MKGFDWGCKWPLACDYPSAPECWPGGTCSGLTQPAEPVAEEADEGDPE